MTVAVDRLGREHAVLSNGFRRIRLDVDAGSLLGDRPVVLHYCLHGVQNAAARVLPLRRLLFLCRHRRFPVSLFPPEPRIARGIAVLRVADAIGEHASHQDIAQALFGSEGLEADARRGSDSLRSRMRRLVSEARALAAGGYRGLMHRGPTPNG